MILDDDKEVKLKTKSPKPEIIDISDSSEESGDFCTKPEKKKISSTERKSINRTDSRTMSTKNIAFSKQSQSTNSTNTFRQIEKSAAAKLRTSNDDNSQSKSQRNLKTLPRTKNSKSLKEINQEKEKKPPLPISGFKRKRDNNCIEDNSSTSSSQLWVDKFKPTDQVLSTFLRKPFNINRSLG